MIRFIRCWTMKHLELPKLKYRTFTHINQKHKQPSKLVTVRHIFHSLSAKYFVLTARNISRWKRTFETQQITSFHLHPKKLHTYTSPTLHNTHTRPAHHPPLPYLTDPTTQKNHPSPTLSNKPENTKKSPSSTLPHFAFTTTFP